MRLRPVSTPKRYAVARAILSLSSLAGRRDYCRFVIASTARTGSTMLTSLLNAHSGILAFGELFRSPEAIGWDIAPFIGNQRGELLAGYRADPVGFLERRVFKRWPRACQAVGFKLFYFHARVPPQSAVREYLASHREIKVLHLKRRNLLAQYCSLQLAHKTDVWSTQRPLTAAPASIVLTPEACAAHFASIDAQERECDAFFGDHPLREVLYEDLSGAQAAEVAAIERFLGVSQEVLVPRTVRQRTAPLSQQIANYADLKRAFAGTPWRHFFDEQAA